RPAPAPRARARRTRSLGWNPEPALDGGPREETIEHSQHVAEILDTDQVAGLVVVDQVAHQREDRDVRYRVLVVHHPLAALEVAVDDAEQAAALGGVAVARALVLPVTSAEMMEEAELPEHRPDAA